VATVAKAAVISISSSGRIVDTSVVPEVAAVPRPNLPLRPPFWPREGVALSPNGTIATFRGDRYVVDLHPMTRGTGGSWRGWRPGDRVIRIERPDAVPVRLPAAERTDWLSREQSYYRNQRRTEQPIVPEIKPLIEWVRFAADGRLLVEVNVPSERIPAAEVERTSKSPLPSARWRARPTFEVYEPSGVLTGRLQLDATERLLAMRGDSVWVLRRLPSETAVLRRYTVRW
jgi:hypothetical protein